MTGTVVMVMTSVVGGVKPFGGLLDPPPPHPAKHNTKTLHAAHASLEPPLRVTKNHRAAKLVSAPEKRTAHSGVPAAPRHLPRDQTSARSGSGSCLHC